MQESNSDYLNQLGRSLFVSFAVRRLKKARVLWVNHRWLNARGIDSVTERGSKEVSNWLLENFAFSVMSDADPSDAFDVEERTYRADRYGGSGIGASGGSGRCGHAGLFCVKGIGRTPLASGQMGYEHSHGGLALEEAVREACISEVVDAEFPHGAVPAVAIIDTGLSIPWTTPDGILYEPRALLVRPAFVRPAHFVRATYFGSSRNLDFIEDVRRVSEAISRVRWTGCRGPMTNSEVSLSTLAQRLGEQLAFSHIHRLSPGAFVLSNMALDGRLVDFGAFAALPTWGQACLVSGQPAFGGEAQTVLDGLNNLLWHLRKFKADVDLSVTTETLGDAFRAGYEFKFNSELRRLFDLEDASDMSELQVSLIEYIKQQQKSSFNVFLRTEDICNTWFSEVDFASVAMGIAASREQSLLALAQSGKSPECIDRSLAMIMKNIAPRDLLFRPELKKFIEARLGRLSALSSVAARLLTEKVINEVISGSRRIWFDEDRAFDTCAYAYFGTGDARWMKRVDGRGILRVRLFTCDGVGFVGDVTVSHLQVSGSSEDEVCCISTDIEVPSSFSTESPVVQWNGRAVNIPNLSELPGSTFNDHRKAALNFAGLPHRAL